MTIENATVAAHAVTPNALSLRELALIGVFYAQQSQSALIRTASGRIAKVEPGDVVGGQTVAAISEDSLILSAPNGRQTVLQMPS